MSLVAIVAGIGLLRRRRWGRSIALGWSGAAVAYVAGDLVTHFAYILPLHRKARDLAGRAVYQLGELFGGTAGIDDLLDHADRSAEQWQLTWLIVGNVLLLVLPVVSVLLVNRPATRDALH